MNYVCLAVVTLLHGEEAEEIVTERNNTKLLDTDVEVEIHPTENLLCIAHLPFDMGDKKFIELVAQYGSIERAFLMRSSGGLHHICNIFLAFDITVFIIFHLPISIIQQRT